LKAALEQLGFSKCHHMTNVMKSGAQVRFWLALSDGSEVVWDGVFGGRFEDREHAPQVYRKHIDHVKATTLGEQLELDAHAFSIVLVIKAILKR
jgi:hypothetical protein